MKRTSPLVAVVASLALALAACADDDPDGGADEPPTEPADEATEETDEPADDDAEVQDEAIEADDDGDSAATAVVTVGSTELGEVLVDADGMTLYMFDVDEQGGESQCADDCAANWPPLATDGDPAAEGGADDALLGTIERDDGSMQVTYDGWPLYHFIGDQSAGDVAGQAVNDVWWVLDASGAPVRDAADAAMDADADDEADAGVGSDY